MNDSIFEFIRDAEGNKIGVIIATVFKGMIVAGYSKTNIKDGDVFNKDYGIELALKRAKGLNATPVVPLANRRQYRNVQVRAFKFFQQATVMSIAGNFIEPKVGGFKEPEIVETDPIKKLQTLEMEIISKLPQEMQLMLQGLADSILNPKRYSRIISLSDL